LQHVDGHEQAHAHERAQTQVGAGGEPEEVAAVAVQIEARPSALDAEPRGDGLRVVRTAGAPEVLRVGVARERDKGAEGGQPRCALHLVVRWKAAKVRFRPSRTWTAGS